MLDLVRIALSRPYTFVVLALLTLITGSLAAMRMPVDIFPSINIPVIAVAWQYTGLPPNQMANRIDTPFERALTTTVDDIEHIEANSYNTFGIVKIFFHPGANIAIANAQVTAFAQTMLKQMPPGATPPLILNYSASTVPIIQLALSGKGLNEQNLTDIGINQVRTRLVTVEGAGVPYPFGGRTPQVMFDLDPAALQARGLTGNDVANALAAQNVITPVGTQKVGDSEYVVNLNNAPSGLEDLANLPIKSVNGAMVYMRDVANVHFGSAVQTNMVHVDGSRSLLLSVFKTGATSTLDIISGIKKMLEVLKPTLPDALQIKPVGDQSVFVTAAVTGVIREGVIAAALTSLMILLFLGSWRSTVIIAVSIPLAVLGSVAILSALGETLNIMTLGGLALAVGILVDDATVTIENINWHLEHGKDVETAIMDGAAQIVTPAFVSLLCICIVFVPMYFLQGVARYLFVPMAEAVMFAMVCSFILSRTLVPTMANYLLKAHAPGVGAHGDDSTHAPSRNPLVRFQRGFEAGFEKIRAGYHGMLGLALDHRRVFVMGFLAFVVLSFGLAPFLGRNFFPSVDAGQMLIHVRVRVGTRLEDTAAQFSRIEQSIRQIIPSKDLETMADSIGAPFLSSINTIYNNTGTIGEEDGDIQIALREGHAPTDDYVKRLREELPKRFPGVTFAFLPADIVSQILNFGSPAPIELQVRGRDMPADFAYANKLLAQIRRVTGVADARIQQSQSLPTVDVNVDRARAQYTGTTPRDVTNSMVVNLAGSSQVAPTYWLNPKNGITYPIVMQTPQYRMDTSAALADMPVNAAGSPTTVLGGIADIKYGRADAVVSEYDIQPMVQIFASTQGRDLGAVAADIQKIIAANAKDAPKGSTVVLRGQVQTMNSAFSGLLFGLLGAIVLIYFLIVVNFQSWADPFVIITALPAALAGIVWILFATHTTLSVPALTGAIMCMGVATANSILVVSFCRERLHEHGDAARAALEAGFTRFRPVCMTALAMVIGMLPMALALGEGGEQNAPLGRAVIGGLVFATVSTLFFVPVVFSIIHRRYGEKHAPQGHPGVTHVPA
ncbi:efflux RND transporter permease subunit [Rhodanobacter sp. 7MK24]|uniref:efflux RND transporter permease subunit n=1 Tax=Rhodanobacter sp. 7MK24 TaxID=2775922 RepID=UPI00177C3877|nr:efflux RND transporter permease subunit [Rhodanobacter sp. 7MK24]MBD8882406.1 efflux RND transporter permease subunit [Rhodanobacter sp. 7MK24]